MERNFIDSQATRVRFDLAYIRLELAYTRGASGLWPVGRKISVCVNSSPNVRRPNSSARRNAELWVRKISAPSVRKTSVQNISEKNTSARNSAASEDSPPCSGATIPAMPAENGTNNQRSARAVRSTSAEAQRRDCIRHWKIQDSNEPEQKPVVMTQDAIRRNLADKAHLNDEPDCAPTP